MKSFVESDIRIHSNAEEILKALVDQEKLSDWWGVADSFIEQKDGGLYTLTWMKSYAGIKFISTGRIRLFDKRSHLHLEDVLYLNYERPIIGPFKILYDVEKFNGYSILKVRQTGFQKGPEHNLYIKAVQEGWPQALVMLKTYLEKQNL